MSDTDRTEESVADTVRDVVTWPGWRSAWAALPAPMKLAAIGVVGGWLTGYSPAQIIAWLGGPAAVAPVVCPDAATVDTDGADT